MVAEENPLRYDFIAAGPTCLIARPYQLEAFRQHWHGRYSRGRKVSSLFPGAVSPGGFSACISVSMAFFLVMCNAADKSQHASMNGKRRRMPDRYSLVKATLECAQCGIPSIVIGRLVMRWEGVAEARVMTVPRLRGSSVSKHLLRLVKGMQVCDDREIGQSHTCGMRPSAVLILLRRFEIVETNSVEVLRPPCSLP